MTQRSNVPRHCEAFPRFDVVRANAECQRGRELCRFVDEAGRDVGEAFIVDADESSVTLAYLVQTTYLKNASGVAKFATEYRPNGVDPTRRAILCPCCGGRKSVIVFRDSWACADCHGLLNRSQLVDYDTRLWERRKALEQEIGRGRPAHMRQNTYAELRKELSGLKSAQRRQVPREAKVVHSHVLRDDWRTPQQCAGNLFHTNYTVLGGQVVPVEGF